MQLIINTSSLNPQQKGAITMEDGTTRLEDAPTIPMRSWIQRVEQHIIERGDIELTLVLSIIAAILSFFGKVDFQVATGSILAIFTLIAFNILRSRSREERLGKTIVAVEKEVPAIKKVGGHLETIKIVAAHLPEIGGKIDNFERHMPTIEKVEKELPNIQTVAERIPAITEVLANLKMYPGQHEAEEDIIVDLRRRISEGKAVKEAIIMRYSMHPELVAQLLESGTKVTFFMQDEKTAELIGSQEQADYIKSDYNRLRRLLTRRLEDYPLTVYKFRPPSSLAGMKLDDQLIYMGWYTYEYNDRANNFRVSHSDDRTQLYGHDKAALIAKKGYYGFNLLERTFDSLIDNYQRDGNATRILPDSSQQSPSKTPIPFQRVVSDDREKADQ